MTVDRWFIGGGAEHTAEAVRRALYASTGGASGVAGADDLKVVPLEVPGTGVRVLTGSGLANSNYVGGEGQSYMGTVVEQESVSIVATGSGAARSDLVVMRVEDPFAAGSPWDEPADGDIALAPYVHIRVISGVPANTVRLQDVPGHGTDTGVALARIDMPASTGTVTAALIVDLRKIAMPRAARQRDLFTPTAGNAPTTEGVWPAGATQTVDIPLWATEITVMSQMLGLLATGGVSSTEFRIRLGANVYSPISGLSIDASTERVDKVVPMRVKIPEAMRGTTQQIALLARRTSPGGNVAANARTSVLHDTELTERP